MAKFTIINICSIRKLFLFLFIPMEKNIIGSLKIERKIKAPNVSFESFLSNHKETIEIKVLNQKTINLISEGVIRNWEKDFRKNRFWLF